MLDSESEPEQTYRRSETSLGGCVKQKTSQLLISRAWTQPLPALALASSLMKGLNKVTYSHPMIFIFWWHGNPAKELCRGPAVKGGRRWGKHSKGGVYSAARKKCIFRGSHRKYLFCNVKQLGTTYDLKSSSYSVQFQFWPVPCRFGGYWDPTVDDAGWTCRLLSPCTLAGSVSSPASFTCAPRYGCTGKSQSSAIGHFNQPVPAGF